MDNTAVATRLGREKNRERSIIAQSNSRSGGIAQFISAVLGTAGVVFAVVMSRPNVRLTTQCMPAAVIALLCVLVMVGSMVVIMWPQLLKKLPHDKSGQEYCDRIFREACAMAAAEGLPLDDEFEEGYNLQLIRDRKEYATRTGLIATAIFTLATIAFFSLLHY